MTERELQRRIQKLQDDFDAKYQTYGRRIWRAFTNARRSIEEVLRRHSRNGVVPKNRLGVVEREIAAVWTRLKEEFSAAVTSSIEDTAETAVLALNALLVAAVGVTTFAAIHELTDATGAVTDGVLTAIGMTAAAFVALILAAIFRRRGTDGKTLQERLDDLVDDLANEMRSTLRQTIREGEELTQITRRVKETIDNERWRIDRILVTEVATAYRTAAARAARRSDVVKALKIIDFPHGSPSVHREHMCYIYANRDEHGMGKGVYPLGTTKILTPHPQCRARLVFVMKEGVLDA